MSFYPNLNSSTTIGNVPIKNRIVSSAHGTSMCTDGMLNEQIVAYHEARARGGAGLIICEAASVHQTGVGAGVFSNIHTDDCIPGFRRLAEVVHRHDTTIFGQLFHPGRSSIAGTSDDATIAVAYAPSAIGCERKSFTPRAMSLSLVQEIVSAHGDAARRMAEAGFDGVEVTGHHSHLVAQFLNPRSNQRTDAYGGDFDNRIRFLVEVLHDIRAKVGDVIAVGLRLSGDEKTAVGLSTDEVCAIAKTIDQLGIVDYFSVNTGSSSAYDGSLHVVPPMAIEAGYIREYSASIKRVVSQPVIATGRINTPELAEAMITQGDADLCGMVRAMICDPELGNKIASDTPESIRYCIGCNQACTGHEAKGAAISCIQYPESGRELEFENLALSSQPSKVLVAGGGPAGLKAAAVAAARGHAVTVFERADDLGGQANFAAALPGRAEFSGIVSNLIGEAERSGATFESGVEVTRALVERESPDVVIVATGAIVSNPNEDADTKNVDMWTILRILRENPGAHRQRQRVLQLAEANVGTNVVIADRRLDWVAMGIAEELARAGCNVRLTALGYMPGQTIPKRVRDLWAGTLHRLDVNVLPYMRYLGVDDHVARFVHMTGGDEVLLQDVDTIIQLAPSIPDTSLEESLSDYAGVVHVIGDSLSPRTAEEAVFDGLKVGAAV